MVSIWSSIPQLGKTLHIIQVVTITSGLLTGLLAIAASVLNSRLSTLKDTEKQHLEEQIRLLSQRAKDAQMRQLEEHLRSVPKRTEDDQPLARRRLSDEQMRKLLAPLSKW